MNMTNYQQWDDLAASLRAWYRSAETAGFLAATEDLHRFLSAHPQLMEPPPDATAELERLLEEMRGASERQTAGFRGHPVPASCQGQVCRVCDQPAQHKLEEVIFSDDPPVARHPLTAYVCCVHFAMVVGKIMVCCELPEDG